MTEIGLQLDPERLLAEEDFVRRLARGLLFDDHRVDDVVQNTWVAALRASKRAATPQSLRAWLATIVRNQAFNETRGAARRSRREREAALGDETHLPSADEVLEREDQRREVVEALRALQDPYRTAVTLRYLEGLEPAEIADSQGVPAATVRSHVRRGLAQMRERLDARHGGNRRAWCLLLVPIARPQDAAALGMATTLFTLGIAMKITLVAAGATALAALAWLAWPADAAPTPIDRSAGTTSGPDATDPLAADPGAQLLDDAAARQVVAANDTSTAASSAADPATLGGYRGRLLAPSGQPLAAATVRLLAFDPSALFLGSPFAQRTAETDAEGEFVFESLPQGADGLLLADVDGPLRQLVSIRATVLGGRESDLGTFQLEDRGQVTGVVHDAKGNPVAGAEVLAAEVPAVALSAFPLHRFDPRRGALLTLPSPTATEISSPELMMQYTGRLRTALARLGMKPVENPDGPNQDTVILDARALLPLWEQLPLARTTTDDEGRFVLHGVSAGNPLLVARPPEGLTAGVARQDGLRVTAGRTTDVGIVELPRGETCAGFVIDPETDEGVPGVEVRVAAIGLLGHMGAAPCEAAVTTDSDGLFEVHGVDRIPHLVALRRGPGEPWTVRGPIAPGEEPEITLPPASPLRIRLLGTASADGFSLEARPTPLLGELGRMVVPEVFHPVAVAEADGSVLTTAPCTHGTWTFRLTHPDHHPRVFVAVLPSEQPVPVNVLPRHPLSVEVVWPNREPCVGATLLVQDVTDFDSHSILPSNFEMPIWDDHLPNPPLLTDSQGLVQLASVTANTLLTAYAPDGSGVAMVEIPAEFRQGRLTMQIRGAGRIEGRIEVGPVAGREASDFHVLIRQPVFGPDVEHAPPFQRILVPDEDGRIVCDPVPVGRYYVELFERDREPLTLRRAIERARERSRVWFRESGIQEQELRVEMGRTGEFLFQVGGANPTLGWITGKVLVDGSPAAGYPVWRRNIEVDTSDNSTSDFGWEANDGVRTAADGTFLFPDLRPGHQMLGLLDPETSQVIHVWNPEVFASRGSEVQTDVRLGSAALTFVDELGQPLVDANVLLEFMVPNRQASAGRLETTDATGTVHFGRIGSGRYEVDLMSSFADFEDAEIDVPPSTMPFEQTFTVTRRYVISATFADSLRTEPNQMVALQVRYPGTDSGTSSGTTGDRVRVSMKRATTYDLYLFIDGVLHRAEPPTITLTQPETTLVVHRGPKVE